MHSKFDCIAMDKLFVGFSITFLPLLLPIAFSYLMIKEDDIVTFYKGAAISDSEEQSEMELASRNFNSDQVTSPNVLSSDTTAESHLHILPVMTWNLFYEQSVDHQSRTEVTVVTIWEISSRFENP